MHILNVEMKDCTFSPETGRFHATLLMEADARRLHMRAAATYHDGMHRNEMAQVMLDDALRQLKRMPEYRNSASEVTVADDALATDAKLPLAA